MIYYFSGTGNSRFVAERLGSLLDDTLVEMTADADVSYSQNDSLGIVFPVYAWGLPQIVARFISKHKDALTNAPYLYAVMTCGDDMGYADSVLDKALDGKLDAAFSLQMPNTYVCLPGFDVDSKEVADAKVQSTLAKLPEVAESIRTEERKTDVVRGAMPWMKTYLLRPLFNRFLVTDRYFRATQSCSLCKRCIRQCPLHNISMQNDRIVWNHENCTGCLRCYHQCPNRAIEFGSFTKNKGQKNDQYK